MPKYPFVLEPEAATVDQLAETPHSAEIAACPGWMGLSLVVKRGDDEIARYMPSGHFASTGFHAPSLEGCMDPTVRTVNPEQATVGLGLVPVSIDFSRSRESGPTRIRVGRNALDVEVRETTRHGVDRDNFHNTERTFDIVVTVP